MFVLLTRISAPGGHGYYSDLRASLRWSGVSGCAVPDASERLVGHVAARPWPARFHSSRPISEDYGVP